MAQGKPLFLYEEIMLLALRDEEGTIANGYCEFMVAGAILAELLLDRREGLGFDLPTICTPEQLIEI